MKLEGRLFRGNHVHRSLVTETSVQSSERFSRQLDLCLVQLCRELDIPLPLWLDKNTREFARFHQTIFFANQFPEPVEFDRFQVRWLE